MKNNGLLVINASAGSGKTYTLARNFIFLLLYTRNEQGVLNFRQQSNYFRHILAITFTNKATGEMKSRIIRELNILASNPAESNFYNDFVKDNAENGGWAHGALNPDAVACAARRALENILFGYSSFNVSTIDVFFQAILRNFARELDRDYNYEVQIDTDFAISQAVHNFLASLGRDTHRVGQPTEVEQWVKAYIKETLQDVATEKDKNSWNIFSDSHGFAKFAKNITSEFIVAQMPRLRAYLTDDDGNTDLTRIKALQRVLKDHIDTCNDTYSKLGESINGILASHGIADGLSGNKSLKKFLTGKLKNGEGPSETFCAITRDSIGDQFLKNVKVTDAAADEVFGWVQTVVRTHFSREILNSLLRKLCMLGLLGEIDRHLHQFCRDANTLLIADTNDLIAHVLNSGVPFVYERVGTWINHFMIDEFQDTSRKQYLNFRPLLEEALAQDGDSLCLLIGDAKQSIYRFRNADVSIFRDQVGSHFTPARHQLETVTLEYNFRSCPNIIRFNNWLVGQLLADFPDSGTLRRTYDPAGDASGYTQQIPDFRNKASEPQGYVRIHLSKPDGESFAENDVLEQLPDYLNTLHERFAWQHIGILVNKKKDGNAIVDRILEYNKTVDPDRAIPFVSEESLRICTSPGVRRLIGLLRFIDLTQFVGQDPDNDNADDDNTPNYNLNRRLSEQRLAQVLGLFLDELPKLGPDANAGALLARCFRQCDEITQLPPDRQLLQFAEVVNSLLPDGRTELLTLNNIVEHLIASISTTATAHDTSYLLSFQDVVQDYLATGSAGTIREFLRYWDTNETKFTIAPAAARDAVTIMTIHKAKGLEFTCVVIPKLDIKVEAEDGQPTNTFWLTDSEWKAQGGNTILKLPPGTELPPLLPLGASILKSARKSLGLFANFVDSNDSAVLIDNLNKIYVAFTRPREELHLFCISASEKKKGINITDYLRRYVAADGSPFTSADDGNTWEYGTPRRTPVTESRRDNIDTLRHSVITNGVTRVAVRLPEDLSDKQNTGLRLHNLLSRIRYRTDLERAWQFCLQRGIIGNDDAEWPLERVRKLVEGLFSDPRMSCWWDDANQVFCERPLVGLIDGTALRPDRVVHTPDNRWIVVDYKFGNEITDDHARQVGRYCAVLEQMGCNAVEGYVWYIAHDRIARVIGSQFSWND